MNKAINDNKKEKGQVMLVSIMILGGVMIGVTAIAGLLFVFQRQQVTDAVDSARALAAADSGQEHINFLIWNEDIDCEDGAEVDDPLNFDAPDTSYEAWCELDPDALRIFSEGYSRDITRFLDAIFTE